MFIQDSYTYKHFASLIAAISTHTQNTDQYLDFGGLNQVTVVDRCYRTVLCLNPDHIISKHIINC